MFSALKALDQYLSTFRRQTGILVDVHSVPLLITDGLQLQLFRMGPNEQPGENSHLVKRTGNGKSPIAEFPFD